MQKRCLRLCDGSNPPSLMGQNPLIGCFDMNEAYYLYVLSFYGFRWLRVWRSKGSKNVSCECTMPISRLFTGKNGVLALPGSWSFGWDQFTSTASLNLSKTRTPPRSRHWPSYSARSPSDLTVFRLSFRRWRHLWIASWDVSLESCWSSTGGLCLSSWRSWQGASYLHAWGTVNHHRTAQLRCSQSTKHQQARSTNNTLRSLQEDDIA